MTRVTLDGVRKSYADTDAVAGIDVEISDGEFFTLVGPSGCGKTTTLRLLAGFEEPTAGDVRFDGEVMTGVPPEDRGVGVVFQNYALFPHLSVRENVAYGLKFHDPPGGVSADERVADLLDLVDLSGLGDRDPGALSGGQQQRVALARALAPGPRLLLLDEPMSALDAQLRERLRLQVKEIQSELGITTVYVTHDQEEALSVSDRVAVLRDGRVEQVGAPREVYRQPATRFVASFVGDNNLFDGRVVGADDSRVAVRVGDRQFGVAREARGDTAGSVQSVAVGDSVTLCVRPEHLRVVGGSNDDEITAKTTNRFPATVRESEFLGATTRVHCEWAGRSVVLSHDDALSGDVTLDFGPADARLLLD
ncbi:ABC transporter ATP-binding protein [Salinirubrum litoreum]|uniref:Molybdate/tungstate import ATP-binding protein WtpC n=1 Tax=Salinirubrum litoreum TaxID=1126234 RepID=A0ABD5R663_9EURY